MMKSKTGGALLEDIVATCLDDTSSVAGLLRKCLVLSFQLKNDTLKEWVVFELNGYGANDLLPSYREVRAPAKGLMLGPGGSSIADQPLPPAMLKEEHRHFAETVKLVEPIAEYQELRNKSDKSDKGGRAVVEWPANLTAIYQKSFFEGRYALNRAWQEIPSTVFASVLDTVRTRILTFALELHKEAGDVPGHLISSIPATAVQSHVTNIIFGNNNFVGSNTSATAFNLDIVVAGDIQSLKSALLELGVENSQIAELPAILDKNKTDTIENRVLTAPLASWVKKAGSTVAAVSKDVGVNIVTQAILKYFGLA